MLFPTSLLGHNIMKQRYYRGSIKDAIKNELDRPNVRILNAEYPKPNCYRVQFIRDYSFPIKYLLERSVYFVAIFDSEEQTFTIERYKLDKKRAPEPFIQSFDLYYIDPQKRLNQVRHTYWINVFTKAYTFFRYSYHWIRNQYRFVRMNSPTMASLLPPFIYSFLNKK